MNRLFSLLIVIVTLVNGPGICHATAPAKPDILSLTSVSRTSVRIKWKANAEEDLAGYDIFRGESTEGPFEKINSRRIPGDQTAYFDSGLSEGTTYSYYIVAVNDGGEVSQPSDIETIYTGPQISIATIPHQGVMMPGETVWTGILVRSITEVNTADGITVTATLLNGEPRGLRFILSPDGQAPFDADHPEAMFRLGIHASPAYPPGVYLIRITAAGTDTSGLEVKAGKTFYLNVVSPGASESRIVIDAPTESLVVGHEINIFGRLVPPPAADDATVSLHIFPNCANNELIITDIPVSERGYFVHAITPHEKGWYCVTAKWAGDAAHGPAESNELKRFVSPRRSRITCASDIRPGETSGVFSGVIFPTPPDNTPVVLIFRFQPADGAPPSVYTVNVLTGKNDAEGHPGSFAATVDLAALHPVEDGVWAITAAWAGDGNTLSGARSETFYFPYGARHIGKVIIIACGNPESRQDEWKGYAALAEYALQTALNRGFARSDITYLSADPSDPESDGATTYSNIESAITGCGAAPGTPLYLYITGRTVLDHATVSIAYILNSSNELLTAENLDTLLDTLPENTPHFVFLDGNNTGFFIRPLCSPGELRNIVSFSGFGATPIRFQGKFSISRYFFTQINQGQTIAEALIGIYSFVTELPPGLRLSVPLAQIGGVTPGEASDDCTPNRKNELAPLEDAYMGFGGRYGHQAPQVIGVSEHQLVDKAPPEIGESQPWIGDAPGGISIWVHCEDPEADLDKEPQYPYLILLQPDGTVSEFSCGDFQPQSDGSFQIQLPQRIFTQEGPVSCILVQVDAHDNISSPAETVVTAINYAPEVIMVGYNKTRLDTHGGALEIRAVVKDDNGARDLTDVQLAAPDSGARLSLSPMTSNGSLAVYGLDLDISDVTLDTGRYLFDITARDASNATSSSSSSLIVPIYTLQIPLLLK